MGSTGFAPLVTVSATYGTGGSVIAPRLAETLGLPFIDRLISADMSQDAARRDRVGEQEERTSHCSGYKCCGSAKAAIICGYK